MTAQFGLMVLGSYLVGSVPAAYIVARWLRGIDIRKYGSGNVGASNLWMSASKWLSVAVIIFDVGKGMVMVWCAHLVGLGLVEQVVVGLAAVIGHNWPVFLRFRGGRGVFATLGVITILSPLLGLYTLVMPYLFAPFRYVALGVFFAYLSVPTLAWLLSEPLNIEEPLAVTLGLVAIVLIGISKRLLAPRTALSKSIPLSVLLFNRLLFDRDISDRKAWIYRPPTSTEASTDKQEE